MWYMFCRFLCPCMICGCHGVSLVVVGPSRLQISVQVFRLCFVISSAPTEKVQLTRVVLPCVFRVPWVADHSGVVGHPHICSTGPRCFTLWKFVSRGFVLCSAACLLHGVCVSIGALGVAHCCLVLSACRPTLPPLTPPPPLRCLRSLLLLPVLVLASSPGVSIHVVWFIFVIFPVLQFGLSSAGKGKSRSPSSASPRR